MSPKTISAHNDLHTGSLYKFFAAIGILLALIVVAEYLTGILSLSEEVWGSLLAFTIIAFGVSFLMWFFKRQFDKLSAIAYEVENEGQ